MKRRTHAGRRLSPDELAALFDAAMRQHGRDHAAVRAVLAEHGYDAVDAVRARRWLRVGQPKTWHPFAFRTHIRPMSAIDIYASADDNDEYP